MNNEFKFTIRGKLHSSFDNMANKAQSKTRDIDNQLGSLKSKFADARNSVIGLAAGGYALSKAYGGAAKTLKAQGELASLGIAEKGITGITKAGQEMALKFGQVTAPEFVRASYDIKSGISSLTDEGVMQFTKLASTTAVATKATTSEMTKLFALGHGIFRQDFASDFQFGNQFSGAVAAAVESFRTDGSDLSQGLSNLGGTATAMGVSMAEQFAIIGLAKETYSTASEAATGYRSFLNSVGKAQEKLGLDFTDSKGKMLGFAEILDMIKDQYGDMDLAENVELAEALGGAEAAKFLTSMIDKTDKLRQSTDYMQKSMEGGITKAEQMAAAMDRGQGLEKLGNSFSYIGFTIGKSLEPAFNGLANVVGLAAKGLAWVDEKASFLIPTVMSLTVAIGGTYAVMKSAQLASMALSFTKLTLAKSYWKATGAVGRFGAASLASSAGLKGGVGLFGKATMAVRAFSLALITNPIGLIIAGIAGAAILVYKYWQPIKAFMGGVWNGFKAGFAPITPLISGLATAFSPVISIAKTVFSWFSDLFTPVNMAQEELAGFASSGEAFGSAIATAFKIALTPITLLFDALSLVGKGIGWLGEKVGLFKADDTDKKESKSFISSLWGSDDEQTTDTFVAPLTKTAKVKKAITGVVAAPILATQLAAADTNVPEVYDHANNTAIVQNYDLAIPASSNSASVSTGANVTQHVTINVTVNNPQNTVDIERAILNATHTIGQTGTSLADEDI